MKLSKTLVFLVALSLLAATAMGQKAKPTPKPSKAVIFAVVDDGTSLEPIAYINKGKLEATADGGSEPNLIAAFARSYYKTGASYRLIFGGANSGTVSVKRSNTKADCKKNVATAVTKAAKTPLKGLVMGLATNAETKSLTSFRRKPTAAEKDEIEILVKAEYAKQKLTPGVLRYHNLTALDLENDGKAEMVGSYWVEIDRLTRGLLFFISGKGSGDKYSIGYSEYKAVDQANVMGGEIKMVDDGVYHELLLDAFDFDADGVSNVFTYTQGFEGASFGAYSKSGNKWVKSFEGSNYHCAY